jgi:hypothetical protein
MTDHVSLWTLEPVIEAMREGLESMDWSLSGLQKTTSHEYEGRWAGESSRSAYLFFHNDACGDEVSIEAFVDETSRGLRANLALVVEIPPLGELPPPEKLLTLLTSVAAECLMEGYKTPISVRFRLPETRAEASHAESEVRIKLSIPETAFEAGAAALSALAAATAGAFETVLGHSDLAPLLVDS